MSAPTTSLSSIELRERLNSDAPPRLLDVRTPAEYETAHIAGAYNSIEPYAASEFVARLGEA